MTKTKVKKMWVCPECMWKEDGDFRQLEFDKRFCPNTDKCSPETCIYALTDGCKPIAVLVSIKRSKKR